MAIISSHSAKQIPLWLTLASLIACGGGQQQDGSTEGDDKPSGEATLQQLYPPVYAKHLAVGDDSAPNLIVKSSLDAADISSLQLEGNDMTLDPNDLESWLGKIPADAQTGALEIQANMKDGSTRKYIARWGGSWNGADDNSGPGKLRSLALDETANVIYATGDKGLFKLDLASGIYTKIAELNCSEQCEIELDFSGSAFIAEAAANNAVAIVKVDLATGDKTIISGPGKGTGRVLRYAYGMAYDNKFNRLIVADFWSSKPEGETNVFEIDVKSGNRSDLIQEGFTDSSVGFISRSAAGYDPMDVWLDPQTRLLYIHSPRMETTAVVNIAERVAKPASVIALNYGVRNNAFGLSAIFVDAANGILYTTNSFNSRLLSLNLGPELFAEDDKRYSRFQPTINETYLECTYSVSPLPHCQDDTQASNMSSLAVDSGKKTAFIPAGDSGIVAVAIPTGSGSVLR